MLSNQIKTYFVRKQIIHQNNGNVACEKPVKVHYYLYSFIVVKAKRTIIRKHKKPLKHKKPVANGKAKKPKGSIGENKYN